MWPQNLQARPRANIFCCRPIGEAKTAGIVDGESSNRICDERKRCLCKAPNRSIPLSRKKSCNYFHAHGGACNNARAAPGIRNAAVGSNYSERAATKCRRTSCELRSITSSLSHSCPQPTRSYCDNACTTISAPCSDSRWNRFNAAHNGLSRRFQFETPRPAVARLIDWGA